MNEGVEGEAGFLMVAAVFVIFVVLVILLGGVS